MRDKKINEQEIVNEAYKISEEINIICDKSSNKDDESEKRLNNYKNSTKK